MSDLSFREIVPHVPHNHEIGVDYVDHGDNWARMVLRYDPSLDGYGEPGVVSGGAVFALMDVASGMAVAAARKKFAPMATLDLRLDYLRPANAGQDIYARAECYKLTRRFGFIRGIAYNDDPGHPIAHVSGIFVMSNE